MLFKISLNSSTWGKLLEESLTQLGFPASRAKIYENVKLRGTFAGVM
jgi:hypothetical protein